MDVLYKVSKQTFWQGIGKVVTSVTTIIVLGIVTRTYAEFGTGIFTLALTYLNIFYLLGDFGFNAHVLKQNRSENINSVSSSEWQKLLGTRILWSLVLIVLSIATLPFWSFSSSEFSQAVIVGSLAILGSSIFVTCNLIFQSKLRYDLSVIASSAGILVGLTLYIWLSDQHAPISSLLIAQSVSWLIIAVLSLIFVKKFLTNIFPIFDSYYIKDLFKQSWPIAATLALNVVYFRIDAFLLAFYKGISEVGIYNVAYSVFQSALVIPTFIMNAYYPLMLKSFTKVKLVSMLLVGLAFLGTFVTFILADWIINFLTDGRFDNSVQVLQILSLSFPAFFLSALFMWLLVAKGKYKQMFFVYLIGLCINLVLNIIFIPQYSIIGAAWVTVMSEYLILLLQVVVLSRK